MLRWLAPLVSLVLVAFAVIFALGRPEGKSGGPGHEQAQAPAPETHPMPAIAGAAVTTAPLPPAPPAPSPLAGRHRILDVSHNPEFAGLAARTVSLDLDNAPPEDALRALYAAFAIPLPLNGRASTFLNALPPTTLHVRDVPLLDALLQFSALSNASLRNLTPDMLEFTLTPTNRAAPPQSAVGVWCVAGPFAVVLNRVETDVNFPPGGAAVWQSTITLTTLAEPQVPVVRYPHQLNVDTFVDENGQAMAMVASPLDQGEPNRSPSVNRLPLKLPASPGHKIALLRGTAPFVLATESTPLEIAVPNAETIARTVAGMKIESEAGSSGAIPEVRLRFSRGEMSEELWKTISPLLAGLPVQAFGGNVAAWPPNVRLIAAAEGSVRIAIVFGRSNTVYPVANRAVLNIPTGVRTVAVPFEFKDVPLP